MQASRRKPQPGSDRTPGSAASRIESAHYLAAAFGGFLVGFGELVRAGSHSTDITVLRISAVLREQFSPLLGAGWVALLMLAVFSTILCSIYRPNSRKESFTLGLSVFAILSAFTPQQQARLPDSSAPKSTLLSFLISDAAAQNRLGKGELGDYYFEFTNQARAQESKGIISVFDKSEQHLLLEQEIDTRKINRLRLPRGRYVLKFECSGCQSMRAHVDVEKQTDAAKITLSGSKLPLSFQRLFRAEIVDIEDVSEYELEPILSRYAAQLQVAHQPLQDARQR